MMSLKKYIVIDGSPVLFPIERIHADVAGTNHNRVESAGFFMIWQSPSGSKVICSGESDSLCISSRPEIDQRLITVYLGLHE